MRYLNPIKTQWIFSLGLLLLMVVLGLAQSRPSPTSAPIPSAPAGQVAGAPTGVLVDPDEDYRLAPGDTIEILVEDATEL